MQLLKYGRRTRMILLTDLERKGDEFVCAMMRYTFSSETMNIHESVRLFNEDKKNPGKILEAIELFSKGLINEALERHTSNLRKQDEGEPFNDFVRVIKILSKN